MQSGVVELGRCVKLGGVNFDKRKEFKPMEITTRERRHLSRNENIEKSLDAEFGVELRTKDWVGFKMVSKRGYRESL